MPKTKRRMQLATPCNNRWEDLEPAEGGRYCGQCERVVVDLMHVRADEAWRRFDAAGGDICVRIREDAGGNAKFRHEPSPRKGVGAVVFSAALAAACSSPDADALPASSAEVETAEPAPEPTSDPVVVADPPVVDPDDDFHVIEEEDGSDHPAHEGEAHVADHHLTHGRLGGARAVPHDMGEDPLMGLDGL